MKFLVCLMLSSLSIYAMQLTKEEKYCLKWFDGNPKCKKLALKKLTEQDKNLVQHSYERNPHKLKKALAHYAQAFVATIAQKNHTHVVHHSHKLLSKVLLKQAILKNACTGLTQEERGSFNRWNYVYAPHEPFRAMKKRATLLLQEMTKFGLVDRSMAAQEKAKAELDDEIKMFELWAGMFALCVQKM